MSIIPDEYERDVRAEELNNTINQPNIPDFSRDTEATQSSNKPVLLESEIRTFEIGHEDAIKQLIIAFAAGGHVLLEGVPGIAKTLLVNYPRLKSWACCLFSS